MLHFIFDSMSELNHHIGLAAGPDGTCRYNKMLCAVVLLWDPVTWVMMMGMVWGYKA
jgi:hypothetical protein